MTAYTVEKYADEKSWLAARLNGVGASEAAAVVHRSRWCSPFGLYVRKLEQRVVDDDLDHPDAKEMGRRLEPVICQLFTDYGPKLDPFWRIGARLSPYTIYRSADLPHVFCTPDLPILDAQGAVVSDLECKAAYFDAFKTWKKIVPLAYLIQCQQTMYVLGVDRMFIAVLGNGLEFKWHPVERDQELIDRLLPRLDRFWQRVLDKDPPPVDGSQSTTDALRDYYGDGDPGKSIELEDWQYAEMGEQLDVATEARKKAEAAESLLKNKFRDALGDATAAKLPDGSTVTWRTDSRGARTLRRKPATFSKGSAA